MFDRGLGSELSSTGGMSLQYTLLDDEYFPPLPPGSREQVERSGYYFTERAGASVAVFPICHWLRQVIHERPAE